MRGQFEKMREETKNKLIVVTLPLLTFSDNI
jgi:hypothetical protein